MKYPWITFGLLFYVCAPSNAAPLPITPATVSIERHPDGSHLVFGRFMIDVSTTIAWTTLTDYDHIRDFVPSIRQSKKIKSENGLIYVEQTMAGKVGFLSKKVHVLMELAEHPPEEIAFRDTLGSSFHDYEGSWELSQWDNGVAVTYRLKAKPNFYAPNFITNNVFKRDVTVLLEGVRDEMRRRSYLETAGPSIKTSN